jgi:hypothetical protein
MDSLHGRAIPQRCAPTLDLLIKPPGDLNLRGVRADELLHRPG